MVMLTGMRLLVMQLACCEEKTIEVNPLPVASSREEIER